MATYPYISGAGNIQQMISFLRRNFPSSVTSETVKKYGLASNNESYVINALQFVGVIDSDGKRTDGAHKVFSNPLDEDFQAGFSDLVRSAYNGLFDHHGDGAWTLTKQALIKFFRVEDKTSEAIGTRQAAVFQAFSALSGKLDLGAVQKPKASGRPKEARPTKEKPQTEAKKPAPQSLNGKTQINSRDLSMTVRIEINLPAGGTRTNYDDIFKSIRENLLNE